MPRMGAPLIIAAPSARDSVKPSHAQCKGNYRSESPIPPPGPAATLARCARAVAPRSQAQETTKTRRLRDETQRTTRRKAHARLAVLFLLYGTKKKKPHIRGEHSFPPYGTSSTSQRALFMPTPPTDQGYDDATNAR